MYPFLMLILYTHIKEVVNKNLQEICKKGKGRIPPADNSLYYVILISGKHILEASDYMPVHLISGPFCVSFLYQVEDILMLFD